MEKRYRRPLIVIGIVLLVLIGLRIALPYIVKSYLNRTLAHMGQYSGHVADVDMNLWRGAYDVNGLKIVKKSGKVPVPLLNAPIIDISLSWSALFHGAIVSEVTFVRSRLNFVDASHPAAKQTGSGVDWRKQLDKMLPIHLNRVEVQRGRITFRNFESNPKVDIEATDLHLLILNLTNVRDKKGKRVATLTATAKVLGGASLDTKASFDPFGNFDNFNFRLRIRNMQLKHINNLVRAYANLDFASGHGDFVLQLKARNGLLNGYAKPLMHNMKIFSWKQDVEKEHENPFEVAWQMLAGAVGWVFENHSKNQFATQVPISGRIKNENIGTFDAILGVLRNAFIKAYKPDFEHLKPPPKKEGKGSKSKTPKAPAARPDRNRITGRSPENPLIEY
ncbi:MAG: DUF748 domain-containing protein [Gammaproteobacteria bacterium]